MKKEPLTSADFDRLLKLSTRRFKVYKQQQAWACQRDIPRLVARIREQDVLLREQAECVLYLLNHYVPKSEREAAEMLIEQQARALLAEKNGGNRE